LYDPAPIDLGLIAEAMLFYGRVRLIANRDFIISFVRECGPEELMELIEGGFVQITYTDRVPGVFTENH
jgi:hypothetical protein